jgi:hypothetical protein
VLQFGYGIEVKAQCRTLTPIAAGATVADQCLPQIECFINAAERGKTAIREACLELRRLINADRFARGVPPLPNNITVPGEA